MAKLKPDKEFGGRYEKPPEYQKPPVPCARQCLEGNHYLSLLKSPRVRGRCQKPPGKNENGSPRGLGSA